MLLLVPLGILALHLCWTPVVAAMSTFALRLEPCPGRR